MKHTIRKLTITGLFIVAVAALAGCKVTGGGFIQSAYDSSQKATFGFSWQTTDSGGASVKGNWNDGPVKFKLDGGGVITDPADPCSWGEGVYTSTSKSSLGQQGQIDITMCDYGEPGPTNGDYLSLSTTGGPYAAYSNSGYLQGGNLQISKK